jgi:hypothetical protein
MTGHEVGKKLESHETSQLRVFRLINDTHPSAPDLLQNPVM